MEWSPVSGQSTQQGTLPPRRDILVAILLAIFTFGVYILYWLYTTYRDTHHAIGKPHKAVPALVLGIVSYALFIIAVVMYMVVSFTLARGEPGPGQLAGVLGVFGFMMFAALAMTAAQIWLMVGAAFGAEKLLEMRGRKAAIPAIVHVLVPIFVSVWVYVAIGLIQNDLNQLHEPAPAPAPTAYPQG